MHTVFSPEILESNQVSCSHCNWKGKGTDITQEYLFLTDAIELFCPSCNVYLGFIAQEEPGD